MSAPIRRRSRLRLLAPRLVLAAAALALTGSLALALHVRRVTVEGVEGAVRAQVEEVLTAAVGSPTLAVRAEDLRAAVLQQVSWVAEAAVSVSLDGVVRCSVVRREPVAVLTDSTPPVLVDATGRALGEPLPGLPTPALELVAFGAHPEERATLLAALPSLQAAWGAPARRVERLGPRDVALQFDDGPLQVLADPSRPEGLTEGLQVLTAWKRQALPPVESLDVRMPERVVVRLRRQEGGA